MSFTLPIELTNDNFDEVILNEPSPVLVDFWAVWCGPCKMLSPIVDEIAEQHAENEGFKVAKVNVDEQEDLARKFQIAAIPTVLIFKNGEVAKKSVGLVTKDELLETLRSIK